MTLLFSLLLNSLTLDLALLILRKLTLIDLGLIGLYSLEFGQASGLRSLDLLNDLSLGVDSHFLGLFLVLFSGGFGLWSLSGSCLFWLSCCGCFLGLLFSSLLRWCNRSSFFSGFCGRYLLRYNIRCFSWCSGGHIRCLSWCSGGHIRCFPDNWSVCSIRCLSWIWLSLGESKSSATCCWQSIPSQLLVRYSRRFLRLVTGSLKVVERVHTLRCFSSLLRIGSSELSGILLGGGFNLTIHGLIAMFLEILVGATIFDELSCTG